MGVLLRLDPVSVSYGLVPAVVEFNESTVQERMGRISRIFGGNGSAGALSGALPAQHYAPLVYAIAALSLALVLPFVPTSETSTRTRSSV